MFVPIGAHGVCGALLLLAAALLAVRPQPRTARIAWVALLFGAILNAGILSLSSQNLINNNNVQQYLGAKYVFRYADFQRLVNAAREMPQVHMRDLENPAVILRDDPRAQRAYFIDLLRNAGASFDPLTSLDSLRQECVTSGAIRADANRILARGLEPDRVEAFRTDMMAAASRLHWADITIDYGFNGSPFYALVRQMDPTVHRPFDRNAALFGLAWQALSVGLVVWMLRLTFRFDVVECLAAAALVFSSWDFTGYALPGLTFAGLWLPVAAAALAVQRGRHALAGIAIACAGLMKLFPFVLLLPSIVGAFARGSRRPAAIIMLSCLCATLVFGFLASASGRSWTDFVGKITAQFHSGFYIVNSVSASHGLLALGIRDSIIVPLVAIVVFAVFFALCLAAVRSDGTDRARLHWVLVACTGFVTHVWFNYYAMAPLFILPLLARSHRFGAAGATALLATASMLPDFDEPIMGSSFWRALKLAPYLLVPAWMLSVEVRSRIGTAVVRRGVAVVVGAVMLVVVTESLRMHEVHRLAREGAAALDAGDARAAEMAYSRVLRWTPDDASAEMNVGIALAQSGRMQEAGKRFARALDLAPTDPVVVQNYALWLRRAGRPAEAVMVFERLRDLVPWNDGAWLELARIRFEEGRAAEASALVDRALELRPENAGARALRAQICRAPPCPR